MEIRREGRRNVGVVSGFDPLYLQKNKGGLLVFSGFFFLERGATERSNGFRFRGFSWLLFSLSNFLRPRAYQVFLPFMNFFLL